MSTNRGCYWENSVPEKHERRTQFKKTNNSNISHNVQFGITTIIR